jgi:hypothetical protein
MIKINKTFSGLVTCYDEQMLSYSIGYTCVVERSIFARNMKMKSLHFNSIIEGTIREIVSENKMKYFVKDVEDEFNKERNKWIDLVKTNKAEREIRDKIIDVLIDRAKDFNFNLIKFMWMPSQRCHTLEAALS